MKPLNHTQSPDGPSPEQVIADFLERYSTPEGIKLLTSILGQVR